MLLFSGRLPQIMLIATALACASAAGAQNLTPACGGTEGPPAWLNTSTLQGNLGGRPIAMHLDPKTPDNFRYFYAAYGVDIALLPFHQGDTLILQEVVLSDRQATKPTTGCFSLRQTPAGLTGEWTSKNKPSPLPVRLSTVNVATLPIIGRPSVGLEALRTDYPLDFLKLNRPWTASTRLQEPYSGLTYPSVPQAAPGLRAAFQDRLVENAQIALECQTFSGMPRPYHLKTAITLATPRLLSIREDVRLNCVGLADAFTHGLILDRQTGQRLEVSALWPELDTEQQVALYKATLSPAKLALCPAALYTDATLDIYLTPKGLALTPDLSHRVPTACKQTAVIPYAQLRPRLNKASHYYADFATR